MEKVVLGLFQFGNPIKSLCFPGFSAAEPTGGALSSAEAWPGIGVAGVNRNGFTVPDGQSAGPCREDYFCGSFIASHDRQE
jgi:hypothetical protein